MIPVPKSQISSVVAPILKSQAEQYEIGGPEDVAHMVKNMETCYDDKTMAAYVDDLQDPRACLLCGYHFSMMFKGVHVSAYLVWLSDELRNTKEGLKQVKEMLKTLEDYGRLFNAKSVMVSSWLFKNKGPNSQKLWPRFGFEPQELVMSKEIVY